MIMCPDQGVFCGDDVERVGWETYDGRFRVGGVKLISDGSYIYTTSPVRPFFFWLPVWASR